MCYRPSPERLVNLFVIPIEIKLKFEHSHVRGNSGSNESFVRSGSFLIVLKAPTRSDNNRKVIFSFFHKMFYRIFMVVTHLATAMQTSFTLDQKRMVTPYCVRTIKRNYDPRNALGVHNRLTTIFFSSVKTAGKANTIKSTVFRLPPVVYDLTKRFSLKSAVIFFRGVRARVVLWSMFERSVVTKRRSVVRQSPEIFYSCTGYI